MSERRLNYNYAQINFLNIVVSISATWEPIPKDHPYYDKMIPIREYDESLLDMCYIGHDADGYGLFEAVVDESKTSEKSEAEQSETEQGEEVTK